MTDPAASVSPSSHRWLVIAGLAAVSLLAAAGQIMGIAQSLSSDRLAASVPAHGSLRQRASVLVADALGPSDRGVRRYQIDSLDQERVLTLTWSINNDVSNGTVGDGAAADVYGVLYDLATHVSLRQVHLIGTYPVNGRERVVMRVDADHHILQLLRSIGSDGLDPQTLWPLLARRYVNPALAPSASE
jgi:hypothetical protein